MISTLKVHRKEERFFMDKQIVAAYGYVDIDQYCEFHSDLQSTIANMLMLETVNDRLLGLKGTPRR